MISDDRLKELMASIGMPESKSLHGILKQLEMEVRLEYEDGLITNQYSKVMGLQIQELLKIKMKFSNLGINLTDLIEFLDRNEIQIFAELKFEIKKLQNKIEKIKSAIAEL